LAGVATAVWDFSRARRSNTTLEPESGWVRASFDRFVAIRRFGALDGLRAVSVIAVVWHHTSGTPGPSFTHKGSLRVHLFFAIQADRICALGLRHTCGSTFW